MRVGLFLATAMTFVAGAPAGAAVIYDGPTDNWTGFSQPGRIYTPAAYFVFFSQPNTTFSYTVTGKIYTKVGDKNPVDYQFYRPSLAFGTIFINGFLPSGDTLFGEGRHLDDIFVAVSVDQSAGNTVRVERLNTSGVPEPAAWATMALGFGLLGASVRRRRAQPIAA